MAQRKYVSLSKLSTFLDNLKNLFATKKDVGTALNNKQDVITGAATTIVLNDLSKNKALITNDLGKVEVGETTSAEISYLAGVTSSVQTQLNNKVNLDELSNYYTKVDIDDLELITTNDIDTICGTTIQIAREVTF